MANNLECQLPLLLRVQELLEVSSSISRNTKAHGYHLIVSPGLYSPGKDAVPIV
jgi:hypothetical protein